MSEWLKLEIPSKLVGEETVSGNEYVKTYRTEILLPKSSDYSGYCFQHPSKLVSCGADIAHLTYNNTFTFNLVKKDREPGKRYKRFKLTPAELIAVYSQETEKAKAKLARKTERRLAQIGSVEALECRGVQLSYWAVVFRYGNKSVTTCGNEFAFFGDIHNRRVIASEVSRRTFEAAGVALRQLCENYQLILSVRHSLNREVSSRSSDETVAIYDSFYSLSDQWESEFYEKVANILHETSK